MEVTKICDLKIQLFISSAQTQDWHAAKISTWGGSVEHCRSNKAEYDTA